MAASYCIHYIVYASQYNFCCLQSNDVANFNYFFFLFKPKDHDKMKELLAKLSNQLQLDDTSGSIAWAPDDVFAKVMGKERKGRICGVGFGPSPSGRSSKSALTDLQIRSSQSRATKLHN